MLTEEKDNLIQVQSRCPICEKVHDDLDACYSYKKMEVGDEKEVFDEAETLFWLLGTNKQGA